MRPWALCVGRHAQVRTKPDWLRLGTMPFSALRQPVPPAPLGSRARARSATVAPLPTPGTHPSPNPSRPSSARLAASSPRGPVSAMVSARPSGAASKLAGTNSACNSARTPHLQPPPQPQYSKSAWAIIASRPFAKPPLPPSAARLAYLASPNSAGLQRLNSRDTTPGAALLSQDAAALAAALSHPSAGAAAGARSQQIDEPLSRHRPRPPLERHARPASAGYVTSMGVTSGDVVTTYNDVRLVLFLREGQREREDGTERERGRGDSPAAGGAGP